MLVRYFTEVTCGLPDARATLLSAPESWIPGLVQEADGETSRLLARVGIGERVRITKQVEVAFGAPRAFGESLYLPIRWEATGSQGLFPVLEGDLELSAIEEGRTQIALSARYTPPVGGLGEIADRALLRRVAESTIKHFLDGLAARICSGIPVSRIST